METATAETSLDIWVDCPYCDEYVNATEDLEEELEGNLRAEDIEAHVTCDNEECKKTFIVTEITY